jgi:hypothetical protein
MPAIIQKNGVLILDLLVNPMQSRPLSHSFHLAGEKASHSESQSPQLTGNWRKRENTEHSDADEDVQLHKLMEDIKRYIRSIDISNL